MVFIFALIFFIRGPFIVPITHVPDPTLALFFVAGIYLRFWQAPVLLLAGTGLTDVYSFYTGVSTHCLSPAYPLLVPTYLSLWFGGRFFQTLKIDSVKHAARLVGVLFVATFLAFVISSGGFYMLSGKFQNQGLIGFWWRIVEYYPKYAGIAFVYVSIAAVIAQIKSFIGNRHCVENKNTV